MSDIVPRDDVLKDAEALLPYIVDLVEHGRRRAPVQVNTTLTLTYWLVGRAISVNTLRSGRANYGQGILATLSPELGAHFGQGTRPLAISGV